VSAPVRPPRQGGPGHPAGPAPATAGAGHLLAGPRTYSVIAVFLIVLTVMEVAAVYIPPLRPVLLPVLVILSSAKFALVAMFYMHLRFDHRWFTYLFVGPLIIAGGLLISLLWLFHVFGTTGIRAAGGG